MLTISFGIFMVNQIIEFKLQTRDIAHIICKQFFSCRVPKIKCDKYIRLRLF